MSAYECIAWAVGGMVGGFFLGLAIKCYEATHDNNWFSVFYLSLAFIFRCSALFLFQPFLVLCSLNRRRNLIRLLIEFAVKEYTEKEYNVSISKEERESLELMLLETVPRHIICLVAFRLLKVYSFVFCDVCNIVPGEVAKLLRYSNSKTMIKKEITTRSIRENVVKEYRVPYFFRGYTFAPLFL